MLSPLTRRPDQYRVRFLSDLAITVVIPIAILHLLLSWLDIVIPTLLLPLLDTIVVAVWVIMQDRSRTSRQNREARSLDARPIPRVIGNWPGNIDVLWRMTTAFKTSYVGDVYSQLLNEYHCTTLNLRILWQDIVS